MLRLFEIRFLVDVKAKKKFIGEQNAVHGDVARGVEAVLRGLDEGGV